MNVLIYGGADFIGANLACRLLAGGEPVTILDNFCRRGSRARVEWLEGKCWRSPRLVGADNADCPGGAHVVEDPARSIPRVA